MTSCNRFSIFHDTSYRVFDGDIEERRWSVNTDRALDSALAEIWDRSGPLSEWPSDVVVECESRGPTEDMPWTGAIRPLVSDRFKDLLEIHAPSHAQFLPVQMTYRRKHINKPRFWVANWLKVLQVADLNRSEIAHMDKESGSIDFIDVAINEKSVPDDTLIFVMKEHPLIWIIRNDLRKIIEDAEISGIQFTSLVE